MAKIRLKLVLNTNQSIKPYVAGTNKFTQLSLVKS